MENGEYICREWSESSHLDVGNVLLWDSTARTRMGFGKRPMSGGDVSKFSFLDVSSSSKVTGDQVISPLFLHSRLYDHFQLYLLLLMFASYYLEKTLRFTLLDRWYSS